MSTKLDETVAELMALTKLREHHIDAVSKGDRSFNDCRAESLALESAIRTALLNAAEKAFKDGYKCGLSSPWGSYTERAVGNYWLNSSTRAALQGQKNAD